MKYICSSIYFNSGWAGVGLLSQFPPFRYIPNFSASPKYMLAIEYHVHIWQVSPQLSCGDIGQKWMWYQESNRYFGRIENSAYGEINERSFSNHHPRTASEVRIWMKNLHPTRFIGCWYPIPRVQTNDLSKYYQSNSHHCIITNISEKMKYAFHMPRIFFHVIILSLRPRYAYMSQ